MSFGLQEIAKIFLYTLKGVSLLFCARKAGIFFLCMGSIELIERERGREKGGERERTEGQ